MQIRSDRTTTKYSSLISSLKPAYSNGTFVSLSMSALGTMGTPFTSLIVMLDDLKCICNEIFECVFSPKIANSIFLMHNDHIVFAIDAEEG